MRRFFSNILKAWLSVMAMAAGFYSLAVYAEDDCAATSQHVKSQLELIRQDLIAVTSMVQYQQAIQRRYDQVDSLISGVDACIKKQVSGEWLPMKETLDALRSHARILAFTKFAGWREVKQDELDLLGKHPDDKRLIKNAEGSIDNATLNR